MSQIRVLYVEDEPFLAKIVKESLESRGFSVHLVADGNHVLTAFKEWSPDICILDIMLPNKDGYELAEAIRQHRSDLPILFVSAKNQTEDVLRGFKVGGNDYIRKPFSLEELIVRLNNLLQLTQQTNAPSAGIEHIPIGEYSFSPTKLELTYKADSAVQLSYREVQILSLLCQHKNKVLDRKKLLLEVWGDDSFFNSRNLDVYIRKLRNYLAADDQVSILTLKGVGYRFMVGE